MPGTFSLLDYISIDIMDDYTTTTAYGDASNLKDNNSGAYVYFPIYTEGAECLEGSFLGDKIGGWYLNNLTLDFSGDEIFVGWFYFGSPDYFNQLVSLRLYFYDDVDGPDGTGNWVYYDLDLTTLKSGWNSIHIKPSADYYDDISGAFDPSDVQSIYYRWDTTGGNECKLIAIDHWKILSSVAVYGGTSGAPVTLEDFFQYTEVDHASAPLGLWSKEGTSYSTVCGLRIGDGSNTTWVIEKNKTLNFKNYNADHNIAIEFESNGRFHLGELSGGSPISGCAINYPVGLGSDIFTDPSNAAEFKLYQSNILNASAFDLPTGGAGKEVLGCNFVACGEITISSCKFEDNKVVSAPGDGILMTTSHAAKNCQFIDCEDAVHHNPGSAQAYTYDNLTFSGGTYDVHNTSIYTVTVNATNGSDPSAKNEDPGTITIVNTKTLTIRGVKSNYEPNEYVRCAIYAAAGGDLSEDTEIMNEDADTVDDLKAGFYKATISDFNYTSPQPVIYVARHDDYKPINPTGYGLSATITSDGLDVTPPWIPGDVADQP